MKVFTSLTPEAMSSRSHLSYIVCQYILSAGRAGNLSRLSILAEKHLLQEDENEELKRRGLTVFDVLKGNFDNRYDYAFVSQLLDGWNDRLGAAVYIIK